MSREDPPRRYSDEETALILRRASEVEAGGGAVSAGGGLTLEELASIALEAGMDPDAVRRAARLVPAQPDPVQRLLLGAPSHGRVRARFPGSLPASRISEAQHLIERSLQRSGDLHQDATGFLWMEDHGVGRTFVRVRHEGPVTAVEVESDRRGHVLTLMVVLATLVALLLQPLGGFAGLAASLGPLLAVVAPVATVLGGTRLFWPWLGMPSLRRAERTAMELGTLVRQLPPSSGSDAAESGEEGSAKR